MDTGLNNSASFIRYRIALLDFLSRTVQATRDFSSLPCLASRRCTMERTRCVARSTLS
jgi:hypothetical protein